MSELSVNFSRLDSVIDRLRDAEGYYQDRIEHLTDVRDDVNGITNEFGYLSSASFQLSQKISKLEDYYDDISTFRDRVETFRDLAYDEESGLASRLYEDSYDFMEEMGITPEYETTVFDDFVEGVINVVSDVVATYHAVVDFGQTVIEWFQENGQIVRQIAIIYGEFIMLEAEAALFVIGILGAPETGGLSALASVAAAWSMAKTGTALFHDVQALFSYIDGDDEMGDWYASRTLRDDYIDTGRLIGTAINDFTGADFFDDIGGFIGGMNYTVNDVGALVCGLISGIGAASAATEATTFMSTLSELEFGFNIMEDVGSFITDIATDGWSGITDVRNIAIHIVSNTTGVPVDVVTDYVTGMPEIFRDVEQTVYQTGFIPEPVHDFATHTIDFVDSRVNYTGMDSVISNITHAVCPPVGVAYDIYSFIESF